jgi:hypothetical protein
MPTVECDGYDEEAVSKQEHASNRSCLTHGGVCREFQNKVGLSAGFAACEVEPRAANT